MEGHERIARLESDLRALIREYELYLNGANKTEPISMLQRIEKEIVSLSHQPMLNTSQRFKLNSLTSRFHLNKARWQKILKRREEGGNDVS